MATVATVIAQVKWAADRERGGRLGDAKLIPIANLAYKEAWDLLVSSAEDYFVKTTANFTLLGDPSSFSRSLSTETDFYKLKAVQRLNGDEWSAPLLVYVPGGERRGVTFRLEEGSIYFEPQDGCAGTYRIRYVYMPPALTATTDPIVDVNGWVEQYLVDTITVRVRDREEESASLLGGLRQALDRRIEKMAKHRSGGPLRVADVRRPRGWTRRWPWEPPP